MVNLGKIANLAMMKAAVRSRYGPPSVLQVMDIPKPSPKEGEVLVRVQAATVNRTDCGILWGKPFILRFFTGLRKPQYTVTGTDFAGIIEAIGPNVTAFKVGDRVMGFNGITGSGSHAEYLVFPQAKGITSIPNNLTYEEAAACVEGAFYASSGIKKLKPQAGQKALVYGATGAIGSATVQMLKHCGVIITAVCEGRHRDLVRSLGASKIIDYKTEDFTKDPERYDFVFDTVGKTTFAKCKGLLKPKGMYSWSDGLANIWLALITPLLGGKKVVFMPPSDIQGGLQYIKELVEEGDFRPLIDRTYSFDHIKEAFAYVASGQKLGNVVLKLAL